MKKVLIVKLSPADALNSSTIRTLALSKGLLENGCEVDYITIPRSVNHVKGNRYNFMNNINFITTEKNIVYESVSSNKNNKRGLKHFLTGVLRKTFHKLFIYNYTYTIAKKINISILGKNRYDIVVSVSDPKTSHIAVKNLIKQGLIFDKWIQYWGDPMAIDITNKSVYPKWILKYFEKKLLYQASNIIYVSPFTLEEQKSMYPKLANKMKFVPIPYIKEKIYESPENATFTIGYFGAYMKRIRNILPLYEASNKLRNKVFLNIVGDSDITLSNTENIKVYPRGDIEKFEKEADLLVCMLNSSGSQIPGKIYHYAATNKPILVLLDGEMKKEISDYLKSFNRYFICDNDVESIIKTIGIINQNRNTQIPSKEFNPRRIAKQIIS